MKFSMLAIFVALVAQHTQAEEEIVLTRKQIQSFVEEEYDNQLQATQRELGLLELLSVGDEDDDGARALNIKGSAKNVLASLKEKCTCESNNVCSCCFKKEIKIPKTSKVFKPKVCGKMTMLPAEKKMGLSLSVGPITIIKKKVNLKKLEDVCTKVKHLQNIEMCFKMKVTETEEKGTSSCMKAKFNLMGMFSQAIKFPCLTFKEGKLKIDESTFDEDDDEGIKFNIKGAYKNVKKIFGFGKKEKQPAIDEGTDDF